MRQQLPIAFYRQQDVVAVAKALLGKVLSVKAKGGYLSGRIVETEAYNGIQDAACHAYGGRKTNRTAIMYAPGGVTYVYLCYGIHRLLNVITNQAGHPDAVLIRAIEPLEGETAMQVNRNHPKGRYALTSGPGKLSQALGIGPAHNGLSLVSTEIFIADAPCLPEAAIGVGPRIGVAYAGADAALPYRFWEKDNPWISR